MASNAKTIYDKDPYCKDCFYYTGCANGAYKCCHYLLWTGTKRPCDPGEGCTVKVKRTNRRREERRNAVSKQ